MRNKKDIQIPNERQTKISFDPIPHKYYDDNGIVYTSVTTLIGKYCPKFEKKYWAMYTALKNSGYHVRPDNKRYKTIHVDGIPRSLDSLYKNVVNNYLVQQTVAEWTRKTEVACARGNNIHDGLETDINESKGDIKGESNSIIQPHQSLEGVLLKINTIEELYATGLHERYPSIYYRLCEFIKQGCLLFAEKRIYSTAYQVAGMIDVLIVKGKKFAILDWKTNKDIMMFESGYFKKIKVGDTYVKGNQFIPTNDTLLSPLDNLADCKGVKYSLQLSLYAFIMELWGYELVQNGLTICHIRPEMEPKFISCTYYKESIQDLLLDHYIKTILNEHKPKGNLKFGIT